MRVVAGYLGGRIFDSPHGHRTHPMGNRVKTALFNTLGDIKGLTVLDAFAGSGALGLEAISRGAKRAVMVDSEKGAYKTIVSNIEKLDVEKKAAVIHAFVYSWIRRTNETFDIVIADPPYNDLQYKTLEKLPELVKVGGVLVYSVPPTARLVLPDAFELLQQKSYGDATLVFYRKLR